MWGYRGRCAAMLALACAIGCGSDDDGAPDAGSPDAAAPDAAVCAMTMCGEDCVDTATSHDHCGTCSESCTPAQDCAESACACPAITVAEDAFVLAQMDTDMLAPTILGIGLYGDEPLVHALVIGFEDPGTDTGTDIDLAAGAPPFVGLGYDVNVMTQNFRSVYRAQSGTLHLTRRCAAGVAGTIADVAMVEVDPDSDAVIADGCSLSIASLAFDFGDDCPQ
jgi:hypothetical protein